MTHFLYTILQADCVRAMRQLPAASVNFILTDPPYVVRYKPRDGRIIRNDNNFAWIKPAFAEMYRVLAPNSFCVSFYGWAAIDHYIPAIYGAGFRVVGHMTFPKTYASSSGFLRCQHESAYLLAKGHPPKPECPISDVLAWKYSENKHHPSENPYLRSFRLLRHSRSLVAWCLIRFAVRHPHCLRQSRLAAAT